VTGLADLQREFLAYLLSGEPAIAARVATRGPAGRDVRLGIYGHAYRARLAEALETDHEVLGRYLGDALWERMVAGYIDAHPSPHRSLRHYGDRLPAWLAANEPFASHPQIAELAAFERRLMDAFDAAEADRADPAPLAALAPEAWPGLRLRFHPSVQPFPAEWNSVEIWRALKAGTAPPEARARPGTRWLVWRGTDRLTQFRSLDADEAAWLDHFLAGGDFAGACELLPDGLPEETGAQTALMRLRAWLQAGLVSQLVVEA
jgi:Putative DNA-binding domain